MAFAPVGTESVVSASPETNSSSAAPEAAGGHGAPGGTNDAAINLVDDAIAQPPAADSVAVVSPAGPVEPTRWGVLRHRHYRNMLGAQFVSNVGGWMEMFGMQWLVAQKTGSLESLGNLGAAQLLPIMIFGVFGGLVADRVNRKRLLIVTQTMLMLVAAAVAVLAVLGFPRTEALDSIYVPLGRLLHAETAPHVVVPLLILSAINGTVLAFNFPAWQVLTPRLVPRDELTRAITLNGVAFNVTRVIGPALAGFIMGAWGTTPLFIINAASFMFVVLTATTTPDAPAVRQDDSHPFRQLFAAISWAFRSRGPLAILIAMTLMSLLAAPLVRILPLFIIDVYKPPKAEEEWLGGVMLGVQGLGAILGGLALKYIPEWYPKHHFIPMSVCAAGVSITLFAATTALWAGYIAMFICGFFWIWAFNQAWAAMQHLVTDTMRGRVMALVNVLAFGATAIGGVAAGWIGEGLKTSGWTPGHATQTSVAIMSVPLAIAGFVMLLRRTPEVDGMDRRNIGSSGMSLTEAFLARSHRPARENGEK
jgi:MFS family permease